MWNIKWLGIRKFILEIFWTYKTNQWGEVEWRSLGKKIREGTYIGEELVRERERWYIERDTEYLFTYIICGIRVYIQVLILLSRLLNLYDLMAYFWKGFFIVYF